jgi:hypothetical protein
MVKNEVLVDYFLQPKDADNNLSISKHVHYFTAASSSTSAPTLRTQTSYVRGHGVQVQ